MDKDITLFEGSQETNEHIILGCGSEYRVNKIQVDKDIFATCIQGVIQDDITIAVPELNEYVSLVFMQSGKITTVSSDDNFHYTSQPGIAQLVFHRSFSGHATFHKSDKLALFSIVMPYDYLKTVFNNQLPAQLDQYFGSSPRDFYHHEILLSAPIQSVLHQLEHSKPNEALKHLFLRGKTYELVNLCLEQFCFTSKSYNLSQSDINCLKRARDVLASNLETPPSILQLARQVGINDFKLKKGFKALFNTTPYGYLQQRRMLAARQALLDGAPSVTMVANQVGYTNVSHFAAAFRKQFGSTPKGFKKSYQQSSRLEHLESSAE